MKTLLTEKRRAYVYRVSVTAIPLLAALGWMSESKVPLVVALVTAVCNSGLAAANTSTK